MSGDEKLTELLRTASCVLGDDLRIDPRTLISRARRARRRQRIVAACAAVAVVMVGVVTIPRFLTRDDVVDVATGGASSALEPTWTQPPGPGWTRLPDPPLSPRIGATSVAAGNEVVVVGGSTLLCDPGAVCTLDKDPSLADGAAFSLSTRTWRQIAPSPVPFDNQQAIVVDGDVFLLTSCRGISRACSGGLVLLRYRPVEDAWNVLSPPPSGLNYSLTRFGRGLVAYASSDHLGERTDWRLETPSGAWTKLPADPLPPVISRVMVGSGDDLLLFARELRGGTAASTRMIGARLDVGSGRWSDLPPAPGNGFEDSVIDGVAISGSSTRAAGADMVPDGGIFDPVAGAWRPLPSKGWRRPPAVTAATAWRSGVVGVLRKTTATFDYAGGSVLDVEAQEWIELPPIDDRVRASVTSVGRRLIQVGGARSGRLLNDAWVWTPPSATQAN